MNYARNGDRITLEMANADYDRLLVMLDAACGAANAMGDLQLFWSWMKFVNELNAGNPAFTPSAIPAEFLDRRPS